MRIGRLVMSAIALALLMNVPAFASYVPQEAKTLEEIELDVEDTIDNTYNQNFDKGDCTVDVTWPQKVQEPNTGAWYLYAEGRASCPGYDHVAVKTCIQIKTPDGWKKKNCNAGATYSDVLAVCNVGTWKYRTKFRWAAYKYALTGTSVTDPSIDAPSSGVRKVPQSGVDRTCW